MGLTSDDKSPPPERLNDIIRAHQLKKAQELWGMQPLNIAKPEIGETFKDQVFCSKEFFYKKILVLFVHDAPDVVMGDDAVQANKIDLNQAFLLDPSALYFEWATKLGYGIIDVNIPPSVVEHEEDEDGVVHRSLMQNAKAMCTYVWDNYVEYIPLQRPSNLD